MPLCVCPHCETQLWVKDSQLNLAQGYVVCRTCQGLFQARSHTRPTPEHFHPELFPAAQTDTQLVQKIGTPVRASKQLSRQEIAALLDNVLTNEQKSLALADMVKQQQQIKPPAREFNWTLPAMVALTILIIQLFYLALIMK